MLNKESDNIIYKIHVKQLTINPQLNEISDDTYYNTDSSTNVCNASDMPKNKYHSKNYRKARWQKTILGIW